MSQALFAEWKSGPRRRLLVVRQDEYGSMKYGLTNLPAGPPWERYGDVQGQGLGGTRFVKQEPISQLDMVQYQARVWRGCHATCH